jgi:Carboxypeptidase regulatory-like domain/AhpC/TSA family
VSAAATDARGRFSLPLPPGGEYWVRAHADGFDTIDEYPIGVDSRKPPAPLRFTLERTDGFIAGDVVGPDGKPLAGATVTAGRTGATNFLLVHESTITDAGGRFRIEKLPAGHLNVYASLPGRGNEAREQVPVGTANVRFVLQRVAPAPVERPLPPAAAPAVGALAPAIHVAQWVNGDGIANWSDLRGKTVVLQFSSAFNGAARASNAALKMLHTRLREAGRTDVVILAIFDASASAEEVASYARAEGLSFPIGLVEPGRSLGLDSAAFRAYGVRRLPAVFVIDRDGIVRAVDPTPGEVARLGN